MAPGLALVAALVAGTILARAEEPVTMRLMTESFDRDPGWEGVNNRLAPPAPTIRP